MLDRFASPVSVLASFLSPHEASPELVLLSGSSGAGKSSWCLEFLQQARLSGLSPRGLLSPPVYRQARKVGIDLLDIDSGERRPLARLRLGEQPPGGISTEQWQFDPAVLAWGNQILERIQSCELLLLDELGPLELLRGEGLAAGLALLDERRSRLSIAVVRPSLLEQARQRWPWGVVLAAGGQP